MSIEFFESFIKQLGEIVKIPTLAADENGCCYLEFDGKLVVQIQYDSKNDLVLLSAEVVEVASQYYLETCEVLLMANTMWLGGRGATFSLNPTTGMIEMARRLCTCGEYKKFEGALEDFVNALEEWNQRLLDIPGLLAARQAAEEGMTSLPSTGEDDAFGHRFA